jgi:hypothetical protein
MKILVAFKVASWVFLALVVVPPILSFFGLMDLKNINTLALFGTIGWFAATPVWMGKKL